VTPVRHRVLLFDVDLTLLDCRGAGGRALLAAVREVAGRDPSREGITFAGRTDPSIARDLLASAGVPDPAPSLLERLFALYLARLEDELERVRGGRLLPGVEATLGALEGREGVHVGLLTGNIARGAGAKLRRFDLERRFAFGAFGDDAPAREDLLPLALSRWRALGRNGAPPPEVNEGDVFVIGDTARDVAVARAHGACAIGVGTGRPRSREELLAARPDVFLEDLSDAAALLAAIGA
jgi:phosphoglycolate phosphatase-like HAD superfamily hydrolase